MMIEVANLTRYYGEFAALQDVSFKVAEGEIIGLLGLNGAGKSTTLKILAGLIPPSDGTVRVDGVDMVQEPERMHARIGYLPEDPPLYVDMTVQDFIRYAGRLKGMSSADVERRLPEVIATAQLKGRERQVIDTLSHGFRKRVGIASAIIHDPRLVILDEPISGLDPVQIVEMRSVIRNLARGRAVLVSSHILSEIEQTCDRIFVIRDGRLVAQGTEAELTRELSKTSLRVTVSDPQGTFAGWIAAHPAVAKVTAAPSFPGEASAVLDLRDDLREQLARDVINAGYGLRGMQSAQDALEELFLGIARGGVA
ncbi:MAG TPA: ABC transporter ATP-binding protein [Myxococcota bacterium]|nr:ABC transporter ATP-binding protein [Myxococcota bacterium]